MLACAQLYERFVTRGHQEDTHFVCRTSIATSADFHRTSFGHLLSSERKCTTTRPHHVFMRSCVHAFMRPSATRCRSLTGANPRPNLHSTPLDAPAPTSDAPDGLRCPLTASKRPLTGAKPRPSPQATPLTAHHRSKTSPQPIIRPTHSSPEKQILAPTADPPTHSLSARHILGPIEQLPH